MLLDVVDDVLAIERRMFSEPQRSFRIAPCYPSAIACTSRSWSDMIRSILSFDADFNRWPGFKRIYSVPAQS